MTKIDAIKKLSETIYKEVTTTSFQYRAMARHIRCLNATRGKYPHVKMWLTREDIASL